jgi:hypothetical protein
MAKNKIAKPLHTVANATTVKIAEMLSGHTPASDRAIRVTQQLQASAAVVPRTPEEAGRFAQQILCKMCKVRKHSRVSASQFVSTIHAIFKSRPGYFSAVDVACHARFFGPCVLDEGYFSPGPPRKRAKRSPTGSQPVWFSKVKPLLRQNPQLSNAALAEAVGIHKSMFSKNPYKQRLKKTRLEIAREA